MKGSNAKKIIGLFANSFLLTPLFGLICFASVQAEDRSCSLALSIQGLRNNKGSLRVALFNTSHKKFPDPTKAIKVVLVKPLENRGETSVSLPCGSYALAVAHDENSNGIQDKNILGMPTEGYGFSGDSDTSFGPPEYEKARVSLDSENQPLVIKLIYLFD